MLCCPRLESARALPPCLYPPVALALLACGLLPPYPRSAAARLLVPAFGRLAALLFPGRLFAPALFPGRLFPALLLPGRLLALLLFPGRLLPLLLLPGRVLLLLPIFTSPLTLTLLPLPRPLLLFPLHACLLLGRL